MFLLTPLNGAYRWAAKEAVFKAIGKSYPRINFTDIAVKDNKLNFTGEAVKIATTKGIDVRTTIYLFI